MMRVMRGGVEQALLPSEISRELGEFSFEERHWGAATKMAAPTLELWDIVIVVSDDEEEMQAATGRLDSGGEMVNMPVLTQDGRMLHIIPSPYAMGVHEEQSSSLRLEQSVDKRKRLVAIRVPSIHRLEEMARSGATRLTSGEPSGPEFQEMQQ
ncbi:hypothetical protein NDU88_005253 [Pleurodeles waltl]|uniref:Uncharacterized protein n=1 Tax=Pleurodeles waltl TaxID=8319 RepID=A0AAV7TA31_PLEWA|nr:hypothetical protein NDU88_005253 [Pleurodeles waltl]